VKNIFSIVLLENNLASYANVIKKSSIKDEMKRVEGKKCLYHLIIGTKLAPSRIDGISL
jgi:dihydroxyacid dehydratase/phosphogluconate dehydratase